MLINIQYTYRFRAKLCECTRRMIFLCLLSIQECMMHSTWSIPHFSRTKPQYRWSSESWLCLTMTSQTPGLSSFLENFISPYTCKYICFISRGWGHGLVGKVPTSKHENLNPITDTHIKSMYLHQSTGEAACWPVSPVKSVSFQLCSNPCLERVKWKCWGDSSVEKVIAAQAWKPGFKIAALVHRPGLAELSHKLSPESIVVRRTWRQQNYRDLLDSRVPSSVTNPVSSG